MRSVRACLLVACVIVVAMGATVAVGPYVNLFSGEQYQRDAAREGLAVETKGRFRHRFVVGMEIGAGVAAIWILSDLAKRKKRSKADGCTTEAQSPQREE